MYNYDFKYDRSGDILLWNTNRSLAAKKKRVIFGFKSSLIPILLFAEGGMPSKHGTLIASR